MLFLRPHGGFFDLFSFARAFLFIILARNSRFLFFYRNSSFLPCELT